MASLQMPTNLFSVRDMLLPALWTYPRPPEVKEVDMIIDHLSDQLIIGIVTVNDVLHTHFITRQFIETNSIYKVFDLIKHVINSYAPPMEIVEIVDEYDEAMRAQEAMAQITPQS